MQWQHTLQYLANFGVAYALVKLCQITKYFTMSQLCTIYTLELVKTIKNSHSKTQKTDKIRSAQIYLDSNGHRGVTRDVEKN